MRFLADENVPVKLIKALNSLGHDALRVDKSTPDSEIASRVKKEDRILITLDKDFSNTVKYPPTELRVIHVKIHPAYAGPITEAFLKLLEMTPEKLTRGLVILSSTGPTIIRE